MNTTDYNRRKFLADSVRGAGSLLLLPLSGAAASPVSNFNLSSGKCEGVELVQTADGSRQLRLQKQDGQYRTEGRYLSAVVPVSRGVALSWIPQWVTPQRYKKHSANPIYGPGDPKPFSGPLTGAARFTPAKPLSTSGKWDHWTNGVGIVRSADEKHYHMYYADQKNGIGFAVASINKPTEWKEHPTSPVLKPLGEPHWEGARLNQPRLAKVTDTHWRMYYTGWGQGLWRMGLAESFDGGVTWKRYSDDPILPLGPKGSFDSEAACVPMVVKSGNLWKMWYTGSQNRKESINICYATSSDGIHWNKHSENPVLSTIKDSQWETGVISRPFVLEEDGIVKMWYSMRGPTYRIGYAESLDGIHWERSPISPILDVSPSGWDHDMVEYPEIDIVNGVYRMWYCGNGFGTVGYSEGISDTRLEIRTRTGPTPAPDNSWSDWSDLYRKPLGQPLLSPTQRYLQMAVHFRSANPQLTPSLRSIGIKAD